MQSGCVKCILIDNWAFLIQPLNFYSNYQIVGVICLMKRWWLACSSENQASVIWRLRSMITQSYKWPCCLDSFSCVWNWDKMCQPWSISLATYWTLNRQDQYQWQPYASNPRPTNILLVLIVMVMIFILYHFQKSKYY